MEIRSSPTAHTGNNEDNDDTLSVTMATNFVSEDNESSLKLTSTPILNTITTVDVNILYSMFKEIKKQNELLVSEVYKLKQQNKEILKELKKGDARLS